MIGMVVQDVKINKYEAHIEIDNLQNLAMYTSFRKINMLFYFGSK